MHGLPDSHRLQALRQRLDYLSHTWSQDRSESLLRLYVRILPKLLDAERCSIFYVEPGSNRIWSMYGTDLEERQIEAPREDSIVGRTISGGRCIIDNDLHAHEGFHSRIAEETGFVTRDVVCVPISGVTVRDITGAVQVLNKLDGGGFTETDAALLTEIAAQLSSALENIQINREILRISDGLSSEIDRLASTVAWPTFVAGSEAMESVLDTVRKVAATPVSVFIHGENGTGKELIARMIHDLGERADSPFVPVNCASIPETLMESEFFGYEKGAFTGAVKSRGGYFEEADGGTLFLDEIAEMPLSLQPKFLRALQEGETSRLGSSRAARFDARIISATNRDLKSMVADGAFREDLFYRLYAVEIRVPPLRERRDDIVPLALSFLSDVSRRFGRPLSGFEPEVLQRFEDYAWPGNVRQLRREVERLVALTPEGEALALTHCSPELQDGGNLADRRESIEAGLPDQVRELEVRLIARALAASNGNKAEAARRLGITRQGLHKKLGRYHIGQENS